MKMMKELKAVREWKDAAGVDSRLFLQEVNALVKAVREDERNIILKKAGWLQSAIDAFKDKTAAIRRK